MPLKMKVPDMGINCFVMSCRKERCEFFNSYDENSSNLFEQVMTCFKYGLNWARLELMDGCLDWSD